MVLRIPNTHNIFNILNLFQFFKTTTYFLQKFVYRLVQIMDHVGAHDIAYLMLKVPLHLNQSINQLISLLWSDSCTTVARFR